MSIHRTHVRASPGGLATRLLTVLFGSVFVAVGCLVVAVALGLIPARMTAPPWVVVAAGSVFIAAGGLVIFEAFPVSSAFRKALHIAFIAALALPFNWTAFGPGERAFTRTTSVGGTTRSAPASEASGRLAFGIGAVMLDLIVLAYLLALVRGRTRRAADAPTLQRVTLPSPSRAARP
jgi:hypothetical protein